MTDEIFDIQRACDELKIDKAIYFRILSKAIEQTQQDIEVLRNANQSSDVEQLRAVAHRFKGDYANFRIDVLSKIAEQLDVLARENYDNEKASQLIDQFVENFEKVKAFIENQG